LAWTVEFSPRVVKSFAKLDRSVSERILAHLRGVAGTGDPRLKGKALTGQLGGLWRYRVGSWRVICDIQDHRMVIVAVEVAHRSSAYRS